jgi:hypothetical protein
MPGVLNLSQKLPPRNPSARSLTPLKPRALNFSVRQFSVTVRTKLSAAPDGMCASIVGVIFTFAPSRQPRCAPRRRRSGRQSRESPPARSRSIRGGRETFPRLCEVFLSTGQDVFPVTFSPLAREVAKLRLPRGLHDVFYEERRIGRDWFGRGGDQIKAAP